MAFPLHARVLLLGLIVTAAACDTASPDEPPTVDVPVAAGRFDGTTAAASQDVTLRLFLRESPAPGGGIAVGGDGGAVLYGAVPVPVRYTTGLREGAEVRLRVVMESGDEVLFSGDVRDEGRTLAGVVGGATQVGPIEVAGVILERQDLNYPGYP